MLAVSDGRASQFELMAIQASRDRAHFSRGADGKIGASVITCDNQAEAGASFEESCECHAMREASPYCSHRLQKKCFPAWP